MSGKVFAFEQFLAVIFNLFTKIHWILTISYNHQLTSQRKLEKLLETWANWMVWSGNCANVEGETTLSELLQILFNKKTKFVQISKVGKTKSGIFKRIRDKCESFNTFHTQKSVESESESKFTKMSVCRTFYSLDTLNLKSF